MLGSGSACLGLLSVKVSCLEERRSLLLMLPPRSLSPNVCRHGVYEILVGKGTANERSCAIHRCAGYLGHPFSKSMILLLIYSFFSELWHSPMKGCKSISCVSIHHAVSASWITSSPAAGHTIRTCTWMM